MRGLIAQHRPVQRPPRRVQVLRARPAAGKPPTSAGPGGTGHPADLRPVAASQGGPELRSPAPFQAPVVDVCRAWYRPWHGKRPWTYPLLRKVAGQHGQVPVAHPATAAQPGASQLRRARWKSSNTPMAASKYAMRVRSSPPRPGHCAQPRRSGSQPRNRPQLGAATPGQPGARPGGRGSEPPSRRGSGWAEGMPGPGNPCARQLGVHRNTVRKYARSLTQPTNHQPWRSGSFQPAINRRLTKSLSI